MSCWRRLVEKSAAPPPSPPSIDRELALALLQEIAEEARQAQGLSLGFLGVAAAFAALQPLAGAVHLIIGVGAAGGAFYSYRFWRMRMLLTKQMEILLGSRGELERVDREVGRHSSDPSNKPSPTNNNRAPPIRPNLAPPSI